MPFHGNDNKSSPFPHTHTHTHHPNLPFLSSTDDSRRSCFRPTSSIRTGSTIALAVIPNRLEEVVVVVLKGQKGVLGRLGPGLVLLVELSHLVCSQPHFAADLDWPAPDNGTVTGPINLCR